MSEVPLKAYLDRLSPLISNWQGIWMCDEDYLNREFQLRNYMGGVLEYCPLTGKGRSHSIDLTDEHTLKYTTSGLVLLNQSRIRLVSDRPPRAVKLVISFGD